MFGSVVRRLSSATGRAAANDDGEFFVRQVENRLAPRHEVSIQGMLQVATAEYPCMIRSLSPSGMMIEAEDVQLCVGQQIVVVSEGCEPLVGIVRWFRGRTFGAQFLSRLPLDSVRRASSMAPKGMRARAGRARVRLPAVARFNGMTRNVEVLNISVGGLMLQSGLPFHSAQALMIEFPELMPLGGHVRWSVSGLSGFMFSRLLAIPVAQEIAARGKLGAGWLDEVEAAHRLVRDGGGKR